MKKEFRKADAPSLTKESNAHGGFYEATKALPIALQVVHFGHGRARTGSVLRGTTRRYGTTGISRVTASLTITGARHAPGQRQASSLVRTAPPGVGGLRAVHNRRYRWTR